MINKKTVLILGAGASVPYGFPTGTKLRQNILDLFKEEIKNDWDFRKHPRILGKYEKNEIWNYIRSIQGIDGLSRFISALQKSKKYSVDAFLERRTEFLEIGKALISMVLISKEAEQYIDNAESDWYQYLLNEMEAPVHEFLQNNITILTFNYDRSLEFYFFNSLKNSYGLSDDETVTLLQSIPIIHLHGTLGNLPFITNASSRLYNQVRSIEAIKICSVNIKIIYENEIELERFKFAREHMEDADIVCFLGFGYNPTNLERLGVKEVLRGKAVYGSTYGLTGSEVKRIGKYFNHQINFPLDFRDNLDVLNFLRNYSHDLF